jgi:hypothetical protein
MPGNACHARREAVDSVLPLAGGGEGLVSYWPVDHLEHALSLGGVAARSMPNPRWTRLGRYPREALSLGKRQSRRGIRLAFHSGKRMVGGPLKPEVATKHNNTPERGLP